MALTKIPANLLDKSAHVDFADNEQIRLGNTQGLLIYHSGTHSHVRNTSGGNLYLQDEGYVEIGSPSGEVYIGAIKDGAVNLRYDNVTKFATTSSGASVTGNLAVSGNLTVSGTTTELDTTNLNVTDKNITLNYHASNDTSSNADGAGITIQDAVNSSTDATISWVASSDEFAFSHPASIVNTVGGDTVLNLTGSYGSGNNVAFLGFARVGGAVAGDIRYTDATTDMEIGTSTAHKFSLKTGNTKRLTVDTAGNVGINDTNPDRKVSIIGDSTSNGQYPLSLDATNTDYTMEFRRNGQSEWWIKQSSGSFRLHENGVADHFSLKAGGNVGIGLTSPSYKLDVGHVSSGEIQARFKSSGDTGYTQGAIVLESSDSASSPETRGQGVFMFNHGTDKTWYAGTLYSNPSSYGIGVVGGSTLQTSAADDGSSLAFVIDQSRNVGIGTASPTHKLHVAGTVKVTGTQTFDVDSGGGSYISINHAGNESWTWGAQSGSGSDDYLDVGISGGTRAMSWHEDGKVGIGTTTPDTLLELRKDTATTGYGTYPTLSIRNDNAAGYGAIHFQEGSTQRARVEVGNNSGTPYMGLYTTSGASGITIKDGNVGIGDSNPQHPLKVHLTNGEIAMFGSNDMNSPGRYAGIGLGQVLANSTAHQKVSLVTEGRNDGNYRQNFHILVDAAADNGYAVLADKKFTIDGVYGTISMPLQPSFMCYPAATYSQAAGSQKVYWTGESHDVNNWYNNANHRFTAPVAGNYLFMGELALQATTLGQTYLGIGIRINGSGNIYYGGWAAKTGASNQYEKATSTIIKQLAASDYVEIYVELSSTTSVLGGAGGSLSRFSGQLLS